MRSKMNIFILVWNYLKARPLNTVINIILLSLGIAVITLLLLFNKQLEQKIEDSSRGIDLVVGAKGSPLQIILCNIFHIDFPTGNISLAEAERLSRKRLIKKAIPLALGDSYQTYRIVGTNPDYAALYKGELAEGSWFHKDLEVTIGSNVAILAKLKVGDKFSSAHGLAEGGHDHDEHQYIVKGIMKPSGKVIDNLILTNIESIWLVHEGQNEKADSSSNEHHEERSAVTDSLALSPLVPSIHAGDSSRQITSLLIQYRSPMAAVQLPRLINAESNFQAASPAVETTRLFSILGIGAEVLMGFAYVLILISGLSIFIALYNSLKERRYDMAILRSLGASRTTLFFSVLLEGSLLTLMGSLMGLFTGHAVIAVLSWVVPAISKIGLSASTIYNEEWIILVGSLLLGTACALLPAMQAYRTDISKVLAGNG
jgi:putative ABC transport system permease protein